MSVGPTDIVSGRTGEIGRDEDEVEQRTALIQKKPSYHLVCVRECEY